mmetsp:Transcript_37173/g.85821  ORF Transcript_37173/g.85821 Transcript_37173/m.85821 type:complete len:291 (-) Transcript_37173:1343-2215(-)
MDHSVLKDSPLGQLLHLPQRIHYLLALVDRKAVGFFLERTEVVLPIGKLWKLWQDCIELGYIGKWQVCLTMGTERLLGDVRHILTRTHKRYQFAWFLRCHHSHVLQRCPLSSANCFEVCCQALHASNTCCHVASKDRFDLLWFNTNAANFDLSVGPPNNLQNAASPSPQVSCAVQSSILRCVDPLLPRQFFIFPVALCQNTTEADLPRRACLGGHEGSGASRMCRDHHDIHLDMGLWYSSRSLVGEHIHVNSSLWNRIDRAGTLRGTVEVVHLHLWMHAPHGNGAIGNFA